MSMPLGEGTSSPRSASGVFTGTGSNVDVTLDFTPRYVTLVNVTSDDEMYWMKGMADAEGYKRIAAGTGALVTSGGVTPLERFEMDDSDDRGFRLGTDADMNVNTQVVRWFACE